MQTLSVQAPLLRIGAVCAVLGAVLQVGAGIMSSVAFGSLPTGAEMSVLLPVLAGQSLALWSLMQSCFVVGPVLWVIAFVALAAALTLGWPGTWAKVAVTTILVGAAPHIVSSAVNGFAIPALAQAWLGAAAAEQANLVVIGNALRYVIDGTWATSITLFHGVPFVFAGLAVATSGRFSALLGWLGVLGGLGSVIAGPMLYFGAAGLPTGVSIISAVVISIFMLILGLVMWNVRLAEGMV